LFTCNAEHLAWMHVAVSTGVFAGPQQIPEGWLKPQRVKLAPEELARRTVINWSVPAKGGWLVVLSPQTSGCVG
jgi:hypothetical protein